MTSPRTAVTHSQGPVVNLGTRTHSIAANTWCCSLLLQPKVARQESQWTPQPDTGSHSHDEEVDCEEDDCGSSPPSHTSQGASPPRGQPRGGGRRTESGRRRLRRRRPSPAPHGSRRRAAAEESGFPSWKDRQYKRPSTTIATAVVGGNSAEERRLHLSCQRSLRETIRRTAREARMQQPTQLREGERPLLSAEAPCQLCIT